MSIVLVFDSGGLGGCGGLVDVDRGFVDGIVVLAICDFGISRMCRVPDVCQCYEPAENE